MYNMGKVTYPKIIHFFKFLPLNTTGFLICVTLRIFNKEMAAVEFHESTWGLQPCLTE